MDDRVAVPAFCAGVALLETFNRMDRTSFAKDSAARTFIESWRLLVAARVEVQTPAVRRT